MEAAQLEGCVEDGLEVVVVPVVLLCMASQLAILTHCWLGRAGAGRLVQLLRPGAGAGNLEMGSMAGAGAGRGSSLSVTPPDTMVV